MVKELQRDLVRSSFLNQTLKGQDLEVAHPKRFSICMPESEILYVFLECLKSGW